MALIEDVFKGNAVTGVAIGVAALVLGSNPLTDGRAGYCAPPPRR